MWSLNQRRVTETMPINITKFDVKHISQGPVCIALCAKRGGGKSFLIRDILFHLNNTGVPRVCIFSGTESANNFFGTFVPQIFTHSSDEGVLASVWENQKRLNIQRAAGQLPASTDIRLAIVLDDCAYCKPMMKSNALREIFFNGRHYGVTLIITLQYLMDLSVAMRSNVDVYFFLKENTLSNRNRIYAQCCGFIPTFQMFQDIFQACTENFDAFVVNNRSRSSDPSQICSYYGADPTIDFRFGRASLWKFHEQHFESAVDKHLRLLRQAELADSGQEPDHAAGGTSEGCNRAGKAINRSQVVIIRKTD